MKEVWTQSMDGFPWTKSKMIKATEILKKNTLITFAFGYEKLSVLELLNETVFKVRPDLILHIWSVSDKRIITAEELGFLHKMNYVKKIEANGFANKVLDLSKMTQLNSLKLAPLNQLDISFLLKLKLLKEISLSGKFTSLNSIKNCTDLETIYLSTTIDSFDFLKDLNKVKEVFIDSCIVLSDFTLLNKSTLQKLSITSVKMLEQIDSLANFESLIFLRIDASRLKVLPKMSKLINLRKLELKYMKIWENPEILKTLPALEELELQEINTKLKAEKFYFLTEMNTLKTVDFRFMDFNKNRIEKLTKYFITNEKATILKIS